MRTVDRGLVVVTIIYLIAAVLMWWAIQRRTGEIGYTIDDAYIHGTLAKNIVAKGTFGIIPGQFAAASSSPLWTLLLALVFTMTGPAPWLPAVLATLFGALAIERSNALLRQIGIGSLARAVVILIALLCAPILPILSTGLEHPFHVWALLGLFAALPGFSGKQRVSLSVVFVWALLAAGARYESLFALPPLLIFLALRRQWATAFAMASGMAIPVLAFATYSLAHGGFSLPNSLMMKGNLTSVGGLRAVDAAVNNPHVLVLLLLLTAAAAVSHFCRKPGEENPTWLPISLIAMIWIHLQLARLGWFYRYEGYLMILGLIAATTLLMPLREWLRGRQAALSLGVYVILTVTAFPLLQRSIKATGEILNAARNIHDQQFQMAQVTRHLGAGARVAVNDLGAVSFLADAHVLDLYGLGDNRLARAKVTGSLAMAAATDDGKTGAAAFLSVAHFRELVGLGTKVGQPYDAACLKQRLEEERIDYVICYPAWFSSPNELPTTLIPVETWVLGDNLICGSETVVFYGTSPAAAAKLTAALAAYRLAGTDPQSTNRMHPMTVR